MLPFVDRGKWFFLKGKATQLPGFRKEQNRRCCNAPVCGFANAIHWISALTPRALTSGETRVRSQSRSALGWSLSLPGAMLNPGHSFLSAIAGSTFAERLAGMAAAKAATSIRLNAAMSKDAGIPVFIAAKVWGSI